MVGQKFLGINNFPSFLYQWPVRTGRGFLLHWLSEAVSSVAHNNSCLLDNTQCNCYLSLSVSISHFSIFSFQLYYFHQDPFLRVCLWKTQTRTHVHMMIMMTTTKTVMMMMIVCVAHPSFCIAFSPKILIYMPLSYKWLILISLFSLSYLGYLLFSFLWFPWFHGKIEDLDNCHHLVTNHESGMDHFHPVSKMHLFILIPPYNVLVILLNLPKRRFQAGFLSALKISAITATIMQEPDRQIPIFPKNTARNLGQLICCTIKTLTPNI